MDSPEAVGELVALAARVEALTGPSLIADRDVALAIYPDAKPVPGCDARISVWDGNSRTQLTVKPYTASLDAAMSLVPDECVWTLSSGHCKMSTDGWFGAECAPYIATADYPETLARFPALALTVAALLARAALERPHSKEQES